MFPDPRDVSRTLPLSSEGDARCPSCGETSLLDYNYTTSDEIKALGFTPDEYE